MIVEHGYRERTAQPAVGRLRWVIIGAVVLLAVAIGVVLGGVLVDGTRTATLARSSEYVPASAVMYAEARLDLPGTQRANLRALLERFPAADPDAILGEALATTLDDALADADAPFDYSHDVAPWFDGTAGVAILDYPLNVDPSEVQLPSAVGLFGVRDPEAALGLAEDLRAEIEAEGATFTSNEHAGVTIWTLDLEQTETPMPVEGEGFAYTVTEDQLLLANGDAAIRAALDAEAGESLAEAEGVADLLDALPDERAGTFVVSTAAMMAGMRAELEAAQPGLADALAGYLDTVPPVMVGSVSFAPDAFLADSATALPANESLQPANSERGLAARVPADAIFFADGSKWGPYLEQAILTLKATLALGPMSEEQLAELERVESAMGAELEEFVSWIGDGAMAAGWDGEAPWFGLVLRADDPEAAGRRLNQLGALAELAAQQGGTEISIDTETVDGVEVTTIRLGGGADALTGMPGEVLFQYALDGDVALLGVGDTFVPAALTVAEADSLAGSERFNAAVDRFGAGDNASAFFLDLAALREAVEGAVPPEMMSGYEEVRPNLEPLDFLAGVGRVDGDRIVTRLGLVLR